jgi:hypothetical protein
MEFKTLKELDKIIWVNGEAEYAIKHEVINWIKELKFIGEHNCKESHPFYFFRHDTAPVIDFLMDRFNLKIEDLK